MHFLIIAVMNFNLLEGEPHWPWPNCCTSHNGVSTGIRDYDYDDIGLHTRDAVNTDVVRAWIEKTAELWESAGSNFDFKCEEGSGLDIDFTWEDADFIRNLSEPGGEPCYTYTFGLTNVWADQNNIIQYVEIYLNKNPYEKKGGTSISYYWNFDDNIANDEIDFERVIVHEMGHAIGLAHYDDCGGAMHSEIDLGVIWRCIVCDDANGIRHIYGNACDGNATDDQKCSGGCPGSYSICFTYNCMHSKMAYYQSVINGLDLVRVPGCFMDRADAVYALYKDEIDLFGCEHPEIAAEAFLIADDLARGLDVPLTPITELGKTLSKKDIDRIERLLDKAIHVASPGLAHELTRLKPIIRGLEGKHVGEVLYMAYTRPLDPDHILESKETEKRFWFRPLVFRGHVEFRFFIPEKTDMSLTLYDGIGRRVKVIYDRATVFPGEYSVLWDGTNSAGHLVTSGTYIYRIETTTGIYSVGKFLLLE